MTSLFLLRKLAKYLVLGILFILLSGEKAFPQVFPLTNFSPFDSLGTSILAAPTGYCDRMPDGHFIDIHVHMGSNPETIESNSEFRSIVRELNEQALLLNFTANILIYHQHISWWLSIPPELHSNSAWRYGMV